MLDLTIIEPPVWGDIDSGLRFVSEALKAYEDALAAYSGKAESKSTSKVSAVLEQVQESDPEAVEIADSILNTLRSAIIDAQNANPNVAVVLFPELDDIKKVVGSWREEATVEVSVDSTEDDEDRDLVTEYETLDKARTMIQGTFMTWGLDVSKLPVKFQGEKKERIDGKNVATGDRFLKFPGKLTSPNSEGKTGPGREPTSYSFKWSLATPEGGTLEFPKSVSVTTLARLCSSEFDLLSFSELKTRLDNRGWMDKDRTEFEIPVPRGRLIGKRVQK